jgi:hypothetical protein
MKEYEKKIKCFLIAFRDCEVKVDDTSMALKMGSIVSPALMHNLLAAACRFIFENVHAGRDH